MKLFPPLALALTLFAAGAAAQTQFTDPANLRGERVKPSDGRELPIDGGRGNAALGLQQLLRKLNTRASLMLIVAHPDDEDGGMLTYYSRGLGARVADLSLNRGEGGQNAMTGDFEDALGLIRTQELLSADRYMGVDQFFGTEVDFGFSKTKSESFAKWTHERVLYDVVRSIRIYRPLVIASVFIGGVTDGHGQHQVAGQIAQEAFLAAGDPRVFPDMIAEGILPWQPLKVYARVPQQAITPQGLFDYATGQYAPAQFINYVTGEVTTTTPSADVIIHEGNTDPLLGGKSYVQFARIGLGLQKSQIGPNVRVPPTGAFDIAYHLYGSVLCDAPPSARPPTWTLQNCHRERSSSPATNAVEGPASCPPKNCHPERSSSPATNAVEGPASPIAVAQTPTPSNPNPQTANFFDSIDTSSLGLQEYHDIVATFAREIGSATKNFDLTHPEAIASTLADALKAVDTMVDLTEKSTTEPIEKADALHELRIKRVQLNDALALALGLQMEATAAAGDLPAEAPATASATLTKAPSQPLTYLRGWSANSSGDGLGDGASSDGASGITVLNAHPLMRDCELSASQTPVTRPFFTRSNIEQPTYDLVTPADRNAASTPPAFTCWAALDFDGVTVTVGAVVEHDHQPVAFVPPASASAPYLSVGYGDLPRTNYYPRPKPNLHNADLKLPTHRNIAYLPGTGDAVPEALASIGLAATILKVADLTPANLAKYDTVILGVRTYNAHPDLHGAPTQALLDYARNGGNVVVQFQTGEFTAADAPYPLTLGYSAEKVVDETAPVRLLTAQSSKPLSSGLMQNPALQILTSPNLITSSDFNGWVEERGHGFLGSWDARYTALLETQDPGSAVEGVQPQAPQFGGLITTTFTAPNRKTGRWTYCAFALYRELPEAVPGAFRLFVNLLTP